MLFVFAVVLSTLPIESVFMSDLISMTCPRTGAFSRDHNIFHWNFDVTWLLAGHITYGNFINSFDFTMKRTNVDGELQSLTQDATVSIAVAVIDPSVIQV